MNRKMIAIKNELDILTPVFNIRAQGDLDKFMIILTNETNRALDLFSRRNTKAEQEKYRTYYDTYLTILIYLSKYYYDYKCKRFTRNKSEDNTTRFDIMLKNEKFNTINIRIDTHDIRVLDSSQGIALDDNVAKIEIIEEGKDIKQGSVKYNRIIKGAKYNYILKDGTVIEGKSKYLYVDFDGKIIPESFKLYLFPDGTIVERKDKNRHAANKSDSLHMNATVYRNNNNGVLQEYSIPNQDHYFIGDTLDAFNAFNDLVKICENLFPEEDAFVEDKMLYTAMMGFYLLWSGSEMNTSLKILMGFMNRIGENADFYLPESTFDRTDRISMLLILKIMVYQKQLCDLEKINISKYEKELSMRIITKEMFGYMYILRKRIVNKENTCNMLINNDMRLVDSIGFDFSLTSDIELRTFDWDDIQKQRQRSLGLMPDDVRDIQKPRRSRGLMSIADEDHNYSIDNSDALNVLRHIGW